MSLGFIDFFNRNVRTNDRFILADDHCFIIVNFGRRARLFRRRARFEAGVLDEICQQGQRMATFRYQAIAFIAAFMLNKKIPYTFSVISDGIKAESE